MGEIGLLDALCNASVTQFPIAPGTHTNDDTDSIVSGINPSRDDSQKPAMKRRKSLLVKQEDTLPSLGSFLTKASQASSMATSVGNASSSKITPESSCVSAKPKESMNDLIDLA